MSEIRGGLIRKGIGDFSGAMKMFVSIVAKFIWVYSFIKTYQIIH